MIPLDYLYKLAPEKNTKDWDIAITHLREEMVVYKALIEGDPPPPYGLPNCAYPDEGGKTMVHPEVLQVHIARVSEAMRAVGDAHPDPEVRKEWYDQAEGLENAESCQVLEVLKEIGLGIGIIIGAPIVAALATVGGILYGVGMVLKGLGGVMMLGGTLEDPQDF